MILSKDFFNLNFLVWWGTIGKSNYSQFSQKYTLGQFVENFYNLVFFDPI